MPEQKHLLNIDQAAHFVGFCRRTMDSYRQKGIGPRYIRLGHRRIAYRLSDLEEWIASRAAPVSEPASPVMGITASQLDRLADFELQAGHVAEAERLAHLAAEMRAAA